MCVQHFFSQGKIMKHILGVRYFSRRLCDLKFEFARFSLIFSELGRLLRWCFGSSSPPSLSGMLSHLIAPLWSSGPVSNSLESKVFTFRVSCSHQILKHRQHRVNIVQQSPFPVFSSNTCSIRRFHSAPTWANTGEMDIE